MGFYRYDGPVVGRGVFFGRDMVHRSLIDGLHRRRSFLLCGGPRTGRTSTLRHLTFLVHERWMREPSMSKIVPVYIDLDLYRVTGARAFVPALWEQLVAAVLAPEVHGQATPPKLPKLDFRRAKDQWKLFYEGVTTLWDDLAGTGAWCEYCLFIDNIDRLFVGALEPANQPLTLLCQAEPAWAPSSVIAAGGRLIREYLYDPDCAWRFLRPLFLGAFRDTEAEALIRAGIKEIEPPEVQALMHATGKHPYVLQRVLAELELLELSADAVPQAIQLAQSDLDGLFEALWNEFDLGRGVTYRGAYAAPEHALMQLLIDLGQGSDLRSAERELGIRPLKEYAEFLEFAGTAERSMVGDFMRLRSQFDLWNIWYSERIMR